MALFVVSVSANTLPDNYFNRDPRSWLPEDAPVLESSDSEAPAESSPVPSSSASESATDATTDKLHSSSLTDVLSGTSPLAANNGEKPEAFLIHFKPKAGQTSKSKYMLLLKLPDGSTETIESNSETLAPEASQPEKSVPAVEESNRNIQQTTQNQFDDELGFDDDSQSDAGRGGSAAAAAGASGNRFSSSSSASAAAGGSLSSVSAVASAGGATASIEQQLQSDDDQQQRDTDRPFRGASQDSQQQLNDDDLQQQQQPSLDDQGLDQQIIEQQRVEQDRDGGSSASADSGAGGYGQQMNLLSGLTSSPNSGAVYTSYAGTSDQRVPVILIALPPRASQQSQRQTLNRLLGALRAPGGSVSQVSGGTKGGLPAGAPTGARKGGNSLRQGKTSLPASPAAGTKGRPFPSGPAAQEPLPGAAKGGSVSGSLRILGPLSPVAQLAAKGGSGLRVKGTRGQGNTNSPENPQPRHPTGGFGGYGNSHTPSPSGGYGSLSMRLAAKGIPLPTERDVQRPQSLRAILSLARNNANSQAGKKSARLSVRTY